MTPGNPERRDLSKPALPPNPPGIERRKRLESRFHLREPWKGGWLAFETKGEKRRLAPIPDAWESLAIDELQRLCGNATPVRPSRRLVE